ncbi:glycosyltransferase family 9 protein [Pantoea sp. B65]|uniref:glycosyltransferase family 9 protein n=1 Tax=Pantoea sp. B65 TaxID=2813359 RepID=UPI0039B4BDD3
MRKRWKFRAVDLFLRLYTGRKGLLASRDSFFQENQFANIVIYSTTALGDFMMNTPAIRAVRQRFPDALITLVAHQKFRDFLEGGEDWDRVVYWNSKVNALTTLLKQLKEKGKPDLALILHSHEPYDYLSAVMSGAKYIFRDNYSDDNPWRDRWLTNFTYGFKGHLVQRKLELVAPLGCDTHNGAMKVPRPPTAKVAKPDKQKILGFQMGASSAERCWPAESFADVANTLLTENPQASVVLIGGPGEKHLEAPFMEKIEPALRARIHSQIGKTTLPGLVETINTFDAMLTGDTGPLHVAIALQVPTLSLFVTEEPSSSGPYQDRELHRVLYGVRMALKPGSLSNEAMKTITSAQVIACLRADFTIFR